jgi:hypothetical protein
MRNKIKKIPVLGSALVKAGNLRRTVVGKYESWKFYQKYKNYLQKNSSLKDSLKGETVFILATGPSIKKQNLKILAGKNCFSVSNFFVHEDFKFLSPKFHFFAASHDPITGEQYWSWLRDAETHFPEKLNVILSVDSALEYILKIFPKQNVFHYIVGNKKITPNPDLDLTKVLPRIQGITHLALYWAMYMGAKKIYLLGCDHDRILHVGTSTHFYEQNQHAMVRKGYNEWSYGTESMQDRFKAHYELWQKYKEIKEYADKRGIEIWNSTPGSLLDIFPRKELEDAVNETK